MRTFAHSVMGHFEGRYGLLALDGRKRVQKLFKAVAAFQIVNQISEGDACSDEHGNTAKNFRITVDDGCHSGHPNLLASF